MIGKNTYGKPIVHRSNKNAILKIGNYCSIAGNVNIFLKRDVTIGNDVWIGVNVTIMSGVKIGDGCVILTNSIVSTDIEPYSIVGGNPATLINYRYSKEQIDHLLNIKWWNWSDEKLNQIVS